MASLKDIKVNINVDTADFIKSLRQLQESIKMDNVRILKGWTKEERKELEEAKDNGFLSTMTLINGIGDDDDDCHALSEKYYREDPNDNDQMAKDILDFYCGNAKFPEQKYYVKLLDRDEGYLNYQHSFDEFFVDDKDDYEDGDYKTQFTISEIEDIDPRYKQFAVPVEADN